MSTGWDLAVASWRLVWKDRRLLIFPFISAVAVAITLVLVTQAAGGWDVATHAGGKLHAALVWLVMAYPLSLISTFCGVAFASQANAILEGRDPSVRDGLRVAWSRRAAIAWWALIASTVGAVIRLVAQFAGDWASALFAWLLDISWALATLVVVPVLALEGLPAPAALRRSSAIFRSRWKAGATGSVVAGAAWFLMIPGAVLVGAGMVAGPGTAGVTLIAAGIAGMVAALVFSSAVDRMFTVALYRHATDQALPARFDSRTMQNGVKHGDRPGRTWYGRRRDGES